MWKTMNKLRCCLCKWDTFTCLHAPLNTSSLLYSSSLIHFQIYPSKNCNVSLLFYTNVYLSNSSFGYLHTTWAKIFLATFFSQSVVFINFVSFNFAICQGHPHLSFIMVTLLHSILVLSLIHFAVFLSFNHIFKIVVIFR